MKKFAFTLFFVCLFISLTGNSYSQSFKLEKVNQTDLTKLNNPFDAVSDGLIQLDGPNPPSTQAAIITPIGSGGTSTLGRAPQSSTRYQRCYYFISQDEMVASGYPIGSNITSLGFNYSAATAGAIADTFKVYFENGPAIYVDKGTNWTTAISTMTQVHQGTITVPSAPGTVDYTLNNSGAFAYSGSGLWVAFEYQNVVNALGTVNTAICNTALGSVLRNMGSGSNVALSNTMSSLSAFRPETRLGTALDDIVSVQNVIAMGEKLNNCIDTNQFVTNFRHLRSGIDTLTYKLVVKNVTSGFVKDSASFSFILNDTAATTAYFITSNILKTDSIKTDSVIATITASSGEGITGNNTGKTVTSSTYNTINQAITGNANTGGAGFSVVNGEAAMAYDAGSCGIYIKKLNYAFGTTGQTYRIKIQAGDSGMTPGTVLYNSGDLVNTLGANSHTLSSPVFIPGGRYFVIFNQVAATNISLQFQQEIPIRNDVYYTRAIPLQNSWVPSFGGFKYNVQLETTVNLALGLYLEGFYNGATMVGDTVNVNLRSQTSPYPIIDTDQSYVNASGNGTFNFTNASPNTCYYYEVIHRNHIVTYSNASCNTLNNNTNSFDFRTAGSQALGSNQVLVNSSYATYTADVNQDGVVDVTDYSITDNDAANFVSGYVVTDVNGDEVVDVADLGYCDNNAANFVGAITP